MFTTILENATCEIVEKKSKFIANIYYIESKEDAEIKIKETKKKYHDARHNCIAYRVIENESIIEKSSDDGEPSGTAGAPMLNILQKNNLCNVVVIVTRYFGGILLGTGGLVRCYSEATTQAIDNAQKSNLDIGKEYRIKIEYNEFENFKYYCKKKNINITNIEYGNEVICYIEVQKEFEKDFINDIEDRKINVIEKNFIKDKLIKIVTE